MACAIQGARKRLSKVSGEAKIPKCNCDHFCCAERARASTYITTHHVDMCLKRFLRSTFCCCACTSGAVVSCSREQPHIANHFSLEQNSLAPKCRLLPWITVEKFPGNYRGISTLPHFAIPILGKRWGEVLRRSPAAPPSQNHGCGERVTPSTRLSLCKMRGCFVSSHPDMKYKSPSVSISKRGSMSHELGVNK